MTVLDKRGYNAQEAAAYLGMKRKAFEKHIDPYVPSVKAGTSRIYDRVDLDIAFEEHKRRNGRPGQERRKEWADQHPVSTGMPMATGTSIKSSGALDFASVSASIMKMRKAG